MRLLCQWKSSSHSRWERPSHLRGVNPALPTKMVMASPEAAAKGQYRLPSAPTLFASRTLSGLKSQAPRGEVQSVTHQEVCYTPKELLEFSDLHRRKPENTYTGRNVKWYQAELVDTSSLSRDSAWTAVAQGVRKDSFGWLDKTWTRRWSPASQLEMSHLP